MVKRLKTTDPDYVGYFVPSNYHLQKRGIVCYSWHSQEHCERGMGRANASFFSVNLCIRKALGCGSPNCLHIATVQALRNLMRLAAPALGACWPFSSSSKRLRIHGPIQVCISMFSNEALILQAMDTL